MAHHKKKPTEQQPDKMDQLIDIVTSLASEVKNMKQEIADVKANANTTLEISTPEVIQPWDKAMDDLEYNQKFRGGIWWAVTIQRETPYKVIPIESIIRDEWFVDPNRQWIKKIYRGMWRTFPNKKLATEYLERVQKANPGQQYDIFPV